MRINTMNRVRASAALRAVGLCLTLLALGSCDGTNGMSGPGAETAAALHGTAYGGRQPIAGSTVTVYSAGLTPGDGATQIGQATTDPKGNFSIAAFSPVPAAGQIIYVVLQGGDAGGGSNSALKLMTVAGAFGSASFPSSIDIDELSTVASTSALQGLITLPDCGTVAGNTGLTGSCVAIAGDPGLAKRAATLRSLVDVAGGQASAFLGGAVDGTPLNLTLQKLNSLADILASCVNSAGGVAGDGSACGNLFKIALANDTLMAAFHIAKTPAVNAKGAALFALLAPPLVYTPAVSAAPASWTVGGQRFAYAPDGNDGKVSGYALDPASGRLNAVAGSPFTTGSTPLSATVDPSGRFAYVVNFDDSNVSAYTVDPASGALTQIAGSPFASGNSPSAVVVDPSGRFAYVVTGNDANQAGGISAYTIDPASGALSPIAGSPFTVGLIPNAATISPSGNFIYVANEIDDNISAFTINASSGALTPVAGSPFAAGVTPGSIALDPRGKFAYVANFDDLRGDTLSAYTIDPANGALTPIAGQPFATGTRPLSVTVDPSGLYVYVANDVDNNISAYAIDPANGALTQIAGSPFAAGTGPNSVTVDPSGKFAYVTNDNDSHFLAYTIDPASGALTPVTGSPYGAGAGPFWVAVDPSGQFAYVADADDGNIAAYTIDPLSGALTQVAGSPFAAGLGPQYVTVDPSGRFAYAANIDDGTVSAYTINPLSGALTPVAGSPFVTGSKPAAVTVGPSGKFAYVANQFDDNLSVYAINAASGALTEIAGSPFASGAGPLSVTIDPSGKFAYVANYDDATVSAYTVNATSGALTPVAGSPYNAGVGPQPATLDASGKFVYVVNQADNTVSAYAINASSGALTEIAGSPFAAGSDGSGLISMAVDPSGQFGYIAEADFNDILVFNIDPLSGALTPGAGAPLGYPTDRLPLAVAVDPSGRFAFAANTKGGDVSAYAIDAATGALNEVTGSPFEGGAGNFPFMLAAGP